MTENSQAFDYKSITKLISLSAVIGVVTGLASVIFYHLIQFSSDLFLVKSGAFSGPTINEVTGEVAAVSATMTDQIFSLSHGLPWYLPLITALGGLLTGIIVYSLAPEAEGHGTDAAIEAFHHKKGRIRGRVPLIKALTAAITIGSGGSAGREGPVAQIGAGISSFLADKLKLNSRDRRTMMLAGMSAGIGSIFRAPLGGALFASECLYSETEFEYEAIIPAIISSIVAYSVFSSIIGWGALFQTPELLFRNPVELIFYLLLAGCCAGLGYVYVKIFYGTREIFRRINIPPHFKPAIGGLLLGLIALVYPQILGSGYGWVQLAIYGQMAIGLMLILAFLKIIATSLTIASGGSGGVFAPSLVIGAMLGGAFGGIVQILFPQMEISPAAYVIVGMAGFFAGVANAPISTLIMVCELSGNYGLLPPLMLVCVCAILFSRGFSIYEHQVPTRVDSPAHRGDFIMDILEWLKVKDAIKLPTPVSLVKENTPLKDIVQLITMNNAYAFPTVDSEGNLTGIFSVNDVRRILTDESLASLVIAKDVANEDVITVQPGDDLGSVLRKMTSKKVSELPVVDPQDPRKILGMISRLDLINAYNRMVSSGHPLLSD